MNANRTGYLLLNLGTPDSPSVPDVRRYLEQFLMDPYVVDVPTPLRWLIVHGFILPFRPKRSAHAYATIWDDQGSPLLLYSETLLARLQREVAAPIALGMRYGEPSIEHGFNTLVQQGVKRIVAVPLYPQHADSTVTTSVAEVRRIAAESNIEVDVIPAFYKDDGYLRALASSVEEALPEHWDHLLMSYHGLPERHMKKADPTGNHCLRSADCCDQPSPAHATCYRHQVYATSTALAQALQLNQSQYTVSFQSRLGGGWLRPYTDEVLAQLPGRGVRNLVVVCPAFVADNLETLEEIAIQGRKTFTDAGGETLHLVPCLNDHPAWVAALKALLIRNEEPVQPSI